MKTTDLASLGVMLLWLAPFLAAGRLRLGASTRGRGWLSMGAGIAVSYVFIDLLPELNRMQDTFTAAAEGKGLPLPELRVYGAALAGFLLFYSMQNFMAGRRTQSEGKDSPVFHRVDVLGFMGYCGLMSYLLVADTSKNLPSLALYGVAMFLHFWLVDHSLRREHGDLYHRAGRWIIVLGILAGWLAGMLGLASDSVVPTLLGFIAGGVVINSVRGELPEKGEGRALPFVMGALGYAVLLMMIEIVARAGP